MEFSRRVFLSFLGLASVFAVRLGRAVAADSEVAPARDDRLIVVRGWVLRADDVDLMRGS